jgi:hypothetical protein
MSNVEKPVLTPKGAAEELSRLKLLPGFPSKDAASLVALIDLLTKWFQATKKGPRNNRRIVTPEEQLRAVVDHMLEHDREWKGPAHMKDIYEELFRGRPEWDTEGEIPAW